jgi:hypothetical protein
VTAGLTDGAPERPGPDLRRRAVADAARVFDRMMLEVEAGARPSPGTGWSDGAPAAPLDPDALAAIVGALRAYADLFVRAGRQSLDALADSGTGEGTLAPVSMSARAGESASGAVWIHNGTQRSLADVELRLTGLSAQDGTRLRPVSTAFAPRVARVPARSSLTSVLSVLVPGDARPAVYRGEVVSDAVPGACLPLVLVVEQ